jgi:1,4-alpha-glucan branching enzyme
VPGDAWQKFATLRAYYGFMWGHPGKKLLFMGQEFGQPGEWDFNRSLDWWLPDHGFHAGLRLCVRDLNRLYRELPALHARDCEAEGFRWIVVDDMDQSILAWMRYGGPEDRPVAVICNFTPVPRQGYRIGLPAAGTWRELFNSDAIDYGGSGLGNLGSVQARDEPSHGFPASAQVLVPPLATVMFQLDRG